MNEWDLGNGLTKGEMRIMTSPIEMKLGLGCFAMIQLKVGDRVFLIDRDIDSTEGRVFVAPEGLLDIGVQLFISVPRTAVMQPHEIAAMEGK